MALLALLLVSGCGEVSPIGGRPKSDQFLTQERLATIAGPGASRDSIRRQLGEPHAVSRDGTAIAYCRRETVDRKVLTLAVIVPFWTTTSITYYQILGIWFGADGRVIQTRFWEGHDGPHGGNPYEPYSVPSTRHTEQWLEANAPARAR